MVLSLLSKHIVVIKNESRNHSEGIFRNVDSAKKKLKIAQKCAKNDRTFATCLRSVH
jgi:hypothetical protein